MSDINHYKTKLEEEKIRLEEELKSVGRKNPDVPGDWEAKPADFEALGGNRDEVADTIEEFENNTGILKQLEIRYNEVLAALSRIEKGTYGTCSVSGEAIEPERLEANPAATTCIAHKESGHELR